MVISILQLLAMYSTKLKYKSIVFWYVIIYPIVKEVLLLIIVEVIKEG
jgi:hypothetical protein